MLLRQATDASSPNVHDHGGYRKISRCTVPRPFRWHSWIYLARRNYIFSPSNSSYHFSVLISSLHVQHASWIVYVACVTTGKKSIPGPEHVVSSVRIFIPFLFHGEGVDEKCFSEGKKKLFYWQKHYSNHLWFPKRRMLASSCFAHETLLVWKMA